MNSEKYMAKVLLVEDDLDDAHLTSYILKKSKIKISLEIAKDGVEAMAYLRKTYPYEDKDTPDLVLLDLNIPRKDGRQVLLEIKNDATLCEVPVVILTTSSAVEDILASYRNHANCYVTKAADYEGMVSILKKIEDFWFNMVQLLSRIREDT